MLSYFTDYVSHSSFRTAGANPGPRTVSLDLPGLFKHPLRRVDRRGAGPFSALASASAPAGGVNNGTGQTQMSTIALIDTRLKYRERASVTLVARLSWSRENITGVIPRTPRDEKDGS